MSQVDDDSVPGTTLKNLIDEDEILGQFLDMIRKRLELERVYTEGLRKLRASTNPKWNNSPAWAIISHFLTLLEKETSLREDANKSVFSKLSGISLVLHPNQPDQDRITPTTKYENLRPAYDEYLRRSEDISSPECIASLQAWYWQPRTANLLYDRTAKEIGAWILPETDRDYRKSVISQQQCSKMASEWHENKLPDLLERQQQRVEDIKSIVDFVAMEGSRSASQLVQVFATITESIASVSSSRYIAPFHMTGEEEAAHLLMKPAVYRNFYTDGLPAQPVFGLSFPDTSVQNILEKASWTLLVLGGPISIEDAFKLEMEASDGLSIQNLLDSSDKSMSGRLAITALLTNPPPVSFPDVSMQHVEKWPRHKLVDLMKQVSHEGKRHMEHWLVVRQYTPFGEIAKLWCRDPAAEPLVATICRKWDFEHDCPLPDGVERRFEDWKPPILVWKKTQKPYSPSS